MDAISTRIQLDLWWFSWIAFGVAIPLYAFLRQRDPLIRWHEHGNVSTRSFNGFDLGVMLAYFLVLQGILMLGTKPSSEAVTIEAVHMLADILLKVMLASFFIYWLMVRRVDLLESFGLTRLNLQATLIWGGVVGVLAVPLVMAVGAVAKQQLTQFLGEVPAQPVVEAFIKSDDPTFKIVTIVGVVVITPIFEELVYRGYLYGVTKKYSDRFFATLFSCLIFTVAHAGVITLLPIVTLAIFLVLAYELSGSLWVPILIHMLFNLVNVVGMLVASSAG